MSGDLFSCYWIPAFYNYKKLKQAQLGVRHVRFEACTCRPQNDGLPSSSLIPSSNLLKRLNLLCQYFLKCAFSLISGGMTSFFFLFFLFGTTLSSNSSLFDGVVTKSLLMSSSPELCLSSELSNRAFSKVPYKSKFYKETKIMRIYFFRWRRFINNVTIIIEMYMSRFETWLVP